MRHPRCEIYQTGMDYRWRIVGANGREIARSLDEYTTKRRAQSGAMAVLKTAFTLLAHCGPGINPWRDRVRWFREP